LALGTALALLSCPPVALAGTDQVTFGDAASEKAHAFAGQNSPAGAGGLQEPCRRIESGGNLVFDLRCDPNAQNYLTVKFWGSDQEVATIFLYRGAKRIGAYGDSWPELDLGQGEPAFPGRFYYTTYMIPRDMTAGRDKVTLKLGAIGSLNPYAADPAKRENPQKGSTRGIYRAYCHTDSLLTPEADEPQGKAPAAATRPALSGTEVVDDLHRRADQAIGQVMKWQLYGPAWESATAEGKVPPAVIGAIARGANPSATRTAAEWKDALARQETSGNCVSMNALAVYAKAYQSPWSAYHNNPEMIDRVAKGLDFHCVLQGADGAFTNDTWAGGPNRKRPRGSCLEGFGTNALGRAFLLVHKELAEKSLLDRKIDSDGDPATPPIPRRAAYAEMFLKHRDYLASAPGRGHATNQDLAQITALWLANESLRALDPEKAWPREKAMEYVYSAVGLAECPLGGYWVTRKGLGLEPWGTLGGGYCGNYGLGSVGLICRLAELTGDQKVRQRAIDAVHAAVHFHFPSVQPGGGACMRKEEIISTRNTKWPCRVAYGGNDWAAGECKDPAAIRSLQLALGQGLAPTLLPENNAHFVDNVTDLVFGLEHFERAAGLPATDYRLPMEDGQPDYAWADEQGATVVVKHRGMRLYMSLNWRRGFQGDKRDAAHAQVNNIARIHCTTAGIDRIATVAMESPHGFGRLYLCRYGPYLVGMNLTDSTTYNLPVPAGAALAVDLLSGKAFDPKGEVDVPPATTRVLFLGR
jgi:hypothetical protein